MNYLIKGQLSVETPRYNPSLPQLETHNLKKFIETSVLKNLPRTNNYNVDKLADWIAVRDLIYICIVAAKSHINPSWASVYEILISMIDENFEVFPAADCAAILGIKPGTVSHKLFLNFSTCGQSFFNTTVSRALRCVSDYVLL